MMQRKIEKAKETGQKLLCQEVIYKYKVKNPESKQQT